MTHGRAPYSREILFFQNFFARSGMGNTMRFMSYSSPLPLNIIAAGAAENVGGVQIATFGNQDLDLSSFRARNGWVCLISAMVVKFLVCQKLTIYPSIESNLI